MVEKSISEAQRWLRRKPSKNRWKIEIDYILAGKRDFVLLGVGSYRQYVLRLIYDSEDPVRSRAAFDAALESRVETWRPDAEEHTYNTIMLEMIRDFLPANGFTRILIWFSKWGSFRLGHESEGDQLDRLGLSILERRYPGPSAKSDDPALRLYESLLWKFSSNSAHASHAFRRILELRLADPQDSRLRDLIKVPEVLQEFLQYALGANRGLLEDQIGYVLAHCLSIRSEQDRDQPFSLFSLFKQTLNDFGYALEETPYDVFPLRIRPLQNNPTLAEDTDGFVVSLPNSSLSDYEQASSYENRNAIPDFAVRA